MLLHKLETMSEDDRIFGTPAYQYLNLRENEKTRKQIEKQNALQEQQVAAQKQQTHTDNQRLKIEQKRLALQQEEIDFRHQREGILKELRKEMVGMAQELDEFEALCR